jgi:hypothetical protein
MSDIYTGGPIGGNGEVKEPSVFSSGTYYKRDGAINRAKYVDTYCMTKSYTQLFIFKRNPAGIVYMDVSMGATLNYDEYTSYRGRFGIAGALDWSIETTYGNIVISNRFYKCAMHKSPLKDELMTMYTEKVIEDTHT